MSDQRDFPSTDSPFLDGLSAFEAGIDRSGIVPDRPFAEPDFGEDHAQFGMLVGRNRVIEFSMGAEGMRVQSGRFSGRRRRDLSTAGVGRALGIPAVTAERMLDHIGQALHAGIAAYRETARRLANDDTEDIETPEGTAPRQGPAQEATPAQRQPARGNPVDEGIGVRQTRRRRPGPRRPIAPFPDPPTHRQHPGRSSGRSL